MHGMRLAVIALAVGLAACGGDDPEDFGEQVVEAFCEREARCGLYASADTCEESLHQRGWETWMGLGTRYEAALESGRLSFDEEAAERCLDAIRDRDCRLPALSEAAMSRGIEYDPSCQVLRAQRTEGACLAHAECGESGFCRYTETSGCEGTCTPRHGEGGSGDWPEHCAPGLVPSESDGTCQRPRGEGETCLREDSHDYPCAAGLWCDFGTSNTCRRTGTAGDDCSFEQDRPCGRSFLCVAGRCERRAPEGSACTTSRLGTGLQANRCQLDRFCDADAEQPGTCREHREEGDACRNFFECATDQYCADAEPESGTWGRCQKRPRAGEVCEVYFRTGWPITNCPAEHHCSQETHRCVPWVREGERCGPEARCAEGVCSNEGRCTSPEAWTCR